MIESKRLVLSLAVAGMVCMAGCQAQDSSSSTQTTSAQSTSAKSGSSSSNTKVLTEMKHQVKDVVGSYDRPGFVTKVDDGRLWIFAEDSKELAAFKEHGEPAKLVTRIGAGPDGMTIKSPSVEVIDAYLIAKKGFYTKVDEGRLWVFAEDSKELAAFKEHGEPAMLVTRIGAGPNGMTIKAPSVEVIDAYVNAK